MEFYILPIFQVQSKNKSIFRHLGNRKLNSYIPFLRNYLREYSSTWEVEANKGKVRICSPKNTVDWNKKKRLQSRGPQAKEATDEERENMKEREDL